MPPRLVIDTVLLDHDLFCTDPVLLILFVLILFVLILFVLILVVWRPCKQQIPLPRCGMTNKKE